MFRRPSRVGLLVASWFFLASITPSLVPRTWLMQAAITGVCAAYGYGLGVAAAWLGRRVARRLQLQVTMSEAAARWLPIAGWSLLLLIMLLVWLGSLAWQRDTARLVGLRPPSGAAAVLGLAGSLVVAVVLVLAVRGLRTLVRRWSQTMRRFVPPWFARTVAVALVAALLLVVSDSVLYRGFMNYTAAKAAAVNAHPPEGRHPPSSPLRSGGPGSREGWDTLGRNGQGFVSDGADAAAIATATGKPAIEPIRVYAGLRPGRSLRATADAVVGELRRTSAFDRDVLAVMTTTGRGWVDEWSASSIEFLSGGDSAIAAMQYSDLPSFVALMADRQTPADAGRILFDAVYAEWSRRPPDRRPRLVVGGESLGAYGGQAAFADAADMLRRADGAVWVGTPNFTPLWRSLTDGRQRGSPEIAPVVDNGAHVRFATRPTDLARDVYGRPLGLWTSPRVAYVQHASDPITWWSTDLLDTEPAWLREGAGGDVNDMRWASVATFWQLTADLLVANSTPAGHGHRYQEELVPAWAGVLGGDPEADYTAIQLAIRRHFRAI
jgi:uncharacterized membrane protein